MLTTLNEILGKAKREGYGVAAPDAYSSSSVMACFKAAENLKAPLIVSAPLKKLCGLCAADIHRL